MTTQVFRAEQIENDHVRLNFESAVETHKRTLALLRSYVTRYRRINLGSMSDAPDNPRSLAGLVQGQMSHVDPRMQSIMDASNITYLYASQFGGSATDFRSNMRIPQVAVILGEAHVNMDNVVRETTAMHEAIHVYRASMRIGSTWENAELHRTAGHDNTFLELERAAATTIFGYEFKYGTANIQPWYMTEVYQHGQKIWDMDEWHKRAQRAGLNTNIDTAELYKVVNQAYSVLGWRGSVGSSDDIDRSIYGGPAQSQYA